MYKLLATLIFRGTVLLVLCNTTQAEAPSVAQRCFDCHADDGVTENPNIPTLAGIGAFYIENQLTIFAESARPCMVDFLQGWDAVDKCALIGVLSDTQRVAIAEYFDGLAFAPFEQPVDAVLAERGAAIHAENCERCHTENGTQSLDDSAILAGQPMPYLKRQLQNFRLGRRWQPASMARATEDLDDGDIDALVNFYAGVAL